jgi:hypothetical protein
MPGQELPDLLNVPAGEEAAADIDAAEERQGHDDDDEHGFLSASLNGRANLPG